MQRFLPFETAAARPPQGERLKFCRVQSWITLDGLFHVQRARGGTLTMTLRIPLYLDYMATDWQDYAEYMLAIMGNAAGFVNLAGEGCHSPRPAYRPVTKFEARGLRFGHGVWDLLFQKK